MLYRRFGTAVTYSFNEGPVVAATDSYSRLLSVLHWTMGGAIVGCVGTVTLAQNTKDKEWKGRLMWTHKSLALIVLALVPARLGARYFSRIPKALPGRKIEHLAGKLSHLAMYGFMIGLPVSGALMGYYSGFGLPFFMWKIPGASKEDKNVPLAKAMFKVHSLVGQALFYAIPLHAGAAFYHVFKGQKIFSRINPFLH